MSKPGRELERASWLPGPCSSRSLTAALRSLPEWTVPTFLDGAGPLTRSELVHRQVDGRVVPEAAPGRRPPVQRPARPDRRDPRRRPAGRRWAEEHVYHFVSSVLRKSKDEGT